MPANYMFFLLEESLNLRGNNLSGAVPKELVKMNELGEFCPLFAPCQ
jgi:hypothetical protein